MSCALCPVETRRLPQVRSHPSFGFRRTRPTQKEARAAGLYSLGGRPECDLFFAEIQ
jgi:hypothetical protein